VWYTASITSINPKIHWSHCIHIVQTIRRCLRVQRVLLGGFANAAGQRSIDPH